MGLHKAAAVYDRGVEIKLCGMCQRWLAKTSRNFYQLTPTRHTNGWSTYCIPCERERSLLVYFARKERAA